MTESVAFVVCAHLGRDSSDYLFGYLASWKGDDVKMEKVGAVVREVAGGLIERIEKGLYESAS